MSEVVTMVSARIRPERAAEVTARFGAAVRAGMPERRHTSLFRGDGDLVRIVTVWRSREDLERYLSTTDRPFAVTLLEEAGGMPVVDVLELVMDSNTTWWP
jgi:Antibiotic biosynthesis monooxygenase